MSDDNNFSVEAENLKNETKDTVKQVKETIKNTDFKEGAAQTKGFLAEMFTAPISAVKKVASGEENVLFKVIIIMILFMIASFANQLIRVIKIVKLHGLVGNLISLVFSVIQPLLFILVPTIIVAIMTRKNKKPLITIISTLVVASVPEVINRIIEIIAEIFVNVEIISSPVIMMFSAISIILTYFGLKEIFEIEDDEKFIKKFAIIKLISVFILGILK